MSKGADLDGLDDFNVSSLISGSAPSKNNNENKPDGELSYAPIEKFIEDENNARKSYDPVKIKELVESIKAISPKTGKITGVKQPLSVKHHPTKKGFFIINGGSRRYKSAKIAGLKELPYFIDDDNDDYDNVVDNLIRDGLKTEEVALFISERLKEGDKSGEIAKRLGKPASYVSDYSVFFELQAPIKKLFDENLHKSIQGLASLHRAYKKYPEEIKQFCDDQITVVSKDTIKEFVKSLKKPKITKDSNELSSDISENDDSTTNIIETEEQPESINSEKESNKKTKEPEIELGANLSRPAILVKVEERQGKIILKNTLEYGQVLIQFEDGEIEQLEAEQINILAVVED